jgi:hypothetical protein
MLEFAHVLSLLRDSPTMSREAWAAVEAILDEDLDPHQLSDLTEEIVRTVARGGAEAWLLAPAYHDRAGATHG